MHDKLGKYKPGQSRPRPILVKFLRNLDVNSILDKRSQIPSPVIVKPDMTREERNIESKLLSQRWNLIQQGVNRKSIKLRRNQLFVDNQLHGQIINSEYVRSTHKDQPVNSSVNEPRTSSTPEQMEHDHGAQ